ncbi:Arm DNA-binding domain-containing protein [Mesorhizobium sp. M0340]|uniref:Arm DNA-binding domain-containing protein n=1 Tax=Mesorhizobium sp. M0340 TaxID=2956939 RepID=UPI00333A76FD
MPLTEIGCRNAKAIDKPTKLSDGGGLFLLVQPSGGKLWRLAYRFLGKQKTLAFGCYPAVSLRDARSHREAAKELLAKGKDPSEQKKADKRRRQITRLRLLQTNGLPRDKSDGHLDIPSAFGADYKRISFRRLARGRSTRLSRPTCWTLSEQWKSAAQLSLQSVCSKSADRCSGSQLQAVVLRVTRLKICVEL